jgi:hypothetical protein
MKYLFEKCSHMILHLKIQIKRVTGPPVWRILAVPGQFTFHKLHEVIQAAFGWENSHLYQFSPKGFHSSPQIGIVDEEWADEDLENAKKTKLQMYLFEKGQPFIYLYDFGDYWEHQITVLEVTEEKLRKPLLLDGKGACPPEDCGGFMGYEELKKQLANPNDPDHLTMRYWLGLRPGMQWDPKYFNREEARLAIDSLF